VPQLVCCTKLIKGETTENTKEGECLNTAIITRERGLINKKVNQDLQD